MSKTLVYSHFQISPEMVNWVQVCRLARPLNEIHEATPCYLGCVFRVIVLFDDEPSSQSEV